MKLRQIKDFLCKNRLQALCILNGVVLAVGLVVAMLLSDDNRWTNWSLSRLGETTSNRLSAFSFNSGVFLSGLIMVTIGFFMNRGYLKLGQIRSARISGWTLSLFAICMIGVALCPNDTMHAAHFVFSRGIVILMVLFTVKFELFNSSRANLIFQFSDFCDNYSGARLRYGQVLVCDSRSFIGDFCDDMASSDLP